MLSTSTTITWLVYCLARNTITPMFIRGHQKGFHIEIKLSSDTAILI